MPPRDPTGAVVRNLFALQQLSNGESAEVRGLIRALFDEIAASIAKHDPTGVLPRYRRQRVERIIAEIERLSGETFDAFHKGLRTNLARIGRQQAGFAADLLGASVGGAVQIKSGAVTVNQLKAIIDANPFQGETLAGWASSEKQAVVRRVRRQIQLGMAQQETLDDIVRRVRGRSTGRGRFVGGVMDTTTREAEAIVRTSVNFIANRAHQATYEANADVLTAVEFTATLDSRTCFVGGTPVLTPTGWLPIEAIQTGDIVVGGSRQPREVRGTRKVTRRVLAEVRLSNGEIVRCTPDHLWLCADGKWREAGRLSAGMELAETLVAPYITGMATCLVCGAGFEERPHKSNKFCGLPCYRVAQRRGDYKGTRAPKVPCHNCGRPHPRQFSRKRDGTRADHSFCGRACYLAHHSRKVEWSCAGCGKVEMLSVHQASNRRFCSHECRVAHRRPEPVNCVQCGVWFTGLKPMGNRVAAVNGRRTCSDECLREFYRTDEDRKRKIGEAFRGEKHPNWKGGRMGVRKHFRGRDWCVLAERIRRRDGHRCTECGEPQGDTKLHVHHVVPFHNFESVRAANRPSNLRSLCVACHTRVEWQTDGAQMALPLKVAA